MAEAILLPEAEADVDLACAYYETQRPGLSLRFRETLDVTLDTIALTPLIGTVVHKGYRRFAMKIFRYAVFYEVVDGIPYVHAVFHTSQDPEKLMRRLP
ncbi:MAG: type II toxin-antitoxin system RelE/ParE family toxin [Gemmataceae bacterium]